VPFDLFGLLDVLFVGAAVPVLARRTERRLGDVGTPPPPFALQAIDTLVSLGILAALSLTAARTNALPLAVRWSPSGRDVLSALGLLALVLAWGPLHWRLRTGPARRLAARRLPRTVPERVQLGLMSLSSGIVEEIAYRGVLFALLARLTHDWVLAALLCSASDALAHAGGGVAGLLAAAAVALLTQALVRLTGSLVPAMAVHVAKDLATGLLDARRAAREPGGAAAPGPPAGPAAPGAAVTPPAPPRS